MQKRVFLCLVACAFWFSQIHTCCHKEDEEEECVEEIHGCCSMCLCFDR